MKIKISKIAFLRKMMMCAFAALSFVATPAAGQFKVPEGIDPALVENALKQIPVIKNFIEAHPEDPRSKKYLGLLEKYSTLVKDEKLQRWVEKMKPKVLGETSSAKKPAADGDVKKPAAGGDVKKPAAVSDEKPPENMDYVGYYKRCGVKVYRFTERNLGKEMKSGSSTFKYDFPTNIGITPNSLSYEEDEYVGRDGDISTGRPMFQRSSMLLKWSVPDEIVKVYCGRYSMGAQASYRAYPKTALFNCVASAHSALRFDKTLTGFEASHQGTTGRLMFGSGWLPKNFDFEDGFKGPVDVEKYIRFGSKVIGNMKPEEVQTFGEGYAWKHRATGKDKATAGRELRLKEKQDFYLEYTLEGLYLSGLYLKANFTPDKYFVAAVKAGSKYGVTGYALYLYEFHAK